MIQAWSSIVYSLIPNVRQLEQSLSEFANIIDADEVLLFERATFLVVSHAQRKTHKDPHRFEKVSNIIKQFKLSCRYLVNINKTNRKVASQLISTKIRIVTIILLLQQISSSVSKYGSS